LNLKDVSILQNIVVDKRGLSVSFRELKDYIHGLIEAEDYKEAKAVIRLAEKRIKKQNKLRELNYCPGESWVYFLLRTKRERMFKDDRDR